jgi:DNA-binding FrmR family transcriptional regulator
MIYFAVPLPQGEGEFTGSIVVGERDKQAIINRLKSIEGHVRGVQRMVGEDAYCIDIYNQILAVQRALARVNALVLERHLQTCVTTAIRGDDPAERERVIQEMMSVFETASKM